MYRDTGYDPDDRAVLGYDPDIISTTRRVSMTSARRVLAVIVRSQEDFEIYWGVEVRLDSRGGRRFDYWMDLHDNDSGGYGCWVREAGRDGGGVRGRFVYGTDRVVCRVRIGVEHPDKRIRWKLISTSRYEGVTEYAPNDRGWYT
ncbi:MAG: hypothetical protein ACXWXG_02965 [Actinomycetota bacterium]